MATNVAKHFEKLYSWEFLYETIINGFPTTTPYSDNSTFWNNFVVFHSQTNTFIFTLICGLSSALIVWILSLITGLCTWVDKMWSIFPMIYAIHFTIYDCLHLSENNAYFSSIRLWIPTIFVCIWGIRTTHTFYRKGGYTLKFVDQRWTFLKTIISPANFFILNIFFISLYQNILLVLLTLPLYAVQQANLITKTPLNWIDAVATIGLIAFMVLEHLADNQQWEFQERKRIAKANKKTLTGDLKRGFLTHGLFRYSRHPHFFGEMGIWWCVYLFSVAAAYPIHFKWCNPTIIGAFLLTALFQCTTPLTEHLSGLKYPSYQEYKKTTSRLIPLFPGRDLNVSQKKAKFHITNLKTE